MKFPCPQCGLERQIKLSGVSWKKCSQRCSRCSATIIVERIAADNESFAGKVVHCAKCGERFSFAPSCPFCGTGFAGYVLVFPKLPHVAIHSSNQHAATSEGFDISEPGPFATSLLRNRPVRFAFGGIAVVFMALLLGWLAGQLNHGDDRTYLKNYVLAVYGIKSGFDRGRAIGTERVTAGHLADAQAVDLPGSDNEDLQDLVTIKGEVDRLMAELDNPPESLRDSHANLERLYAAFSRQSSLVINPGGAFDSNERALQAAQQDFSRVLVQLKSTLPISLRNEVRDAGRKYNLKFME